MKVAYRVVRLDAEASCLDVEFSTEGQPPIVVGVRWPLADESVDDVIKSYLPINHWFPRTNEQATVAENHSGEVTLAPPTDARGHLVDNSATMQFLFEKKIAAALLKFGVLNTDPTAIEVTQL